MLAYNREQVRYLTLVRRFDNMVESKEESDVVAKISMLRLTIGSGMLRLSSCMLMLWLRLIIGSCSLRLGSCSRDNSA